MRSRGGAGEIQGRYLALGREVEEEATGGGVHDDVVAHLGEQPVALHLLVEQPHHALLHPRALPLLVRLSLLAPRTLLLHL